MYGSIDLVTDKIDVRFVKIKQKSSVKIKIRWQLVNYLQMLWWKIQMLSSLELFVQNKFDLKTNGFGRSYSTDGFVGT